MPQHLKREYNTWNVRINIPKDVRHGFYNKHEYQKSLETSDLEVAERRKIPYVDFVKSKIKTIREGSDEDLVRVALYHIKKIRGIEHDAFRYESEKALEEAVETFIKGGWNTIYERADLKTYLSSPTKVSSNIAKAQQFLNIKDDIDVLCYLDKWFNQYDVKPKTKDEAKAQIKIFVQDFPNIKDIKKKMLLFG